GALSRVTAAHAAALERAGGRTAEQAAAELAQARAAQDSALAAEERAEALTVELDAAQASAADLDARRSTAAETLSTARTALSLAKQRDSDADRVVAEARGEYETVTARIAEARQQIAAATAAAIAIDANADASDRANIARHERDRAIEASDFTDSTDAESALLSAAEIAALDDRVTEHAVAVKKERAVLLDLEMRVLPEERIDLTAAEESAAAARAEWQRAVDADSQARGVQRSLTATVDSAATEHAASATDAAEFEMLRGLADTLAGRSGNTRRMNLETFVLAAELEKIVAAANLRLRDMSAGRYELQHSDALAARGAASGLGIVVFDAFTGHTRPAKSLSGGETFLSSLALALGLAEVVTARAGGVRLDTLFIDEGFG